MKKSIMFLVVAMFLFSGCVAQRTISPQATGYCGDGFCSYEEKELCSSDCTPVATPNSNEKPTELDWLEDTRADRQDTPIAEDSEKFERPIEDRAEPIVEVEPIENVLPEIGFQIASRHNFLAIGENISGVMGTLTGAHLREILRGGSYRSNTEAFGARFSFYEQYLILRSGRVLFGMDDENEIISTYLHYNEGEPVLEYYIRMNGGIFKFFQGQEINFLGHKYIMQEVTNASMLFVGVTSPDSILLRNGHSAIVNGETIASDVLNVTFGYDYIRVIVNAPNEIKMLPGQHLTNFIERKELLTNRIDLAYVGLTNSPYILVFLNRKGSDYRFEFQNNIGTNYSVPIARVEPFQVGNDQSAFHFQEGDGNNDYYIGKKDYFIINNRRELGGVTTLLRLADVDYESELVKFEDPAIEAFYVKFDGDVGTNAFADLIVHGVTHRVYVGENERISIDLTGDGRISEATQVPIVILGNTLVRMNEVNNSLRMNFVVPGSMREDSAKDLETLVVIDNRGVRIEPASLAMEHDSKSDIMLGLTGFGSGFLLKDVIDDDEQLGKELLINQPLTQRFANAILQAYE